MMPLLCPTRAGEGFELSFTEILQRGWIIFLIYLSVLSISQFLECSLANNTFVQLLLYNTIF